jgi:uncharacterized protein
VLVNKEPRTSKRGLLIGYLLFSHGWTWFFWFIATLWGTTIWQPPAVYFFFIGGMGVLLGGIVMNRLAYGKAGLRDLASRIMDPRRITGLWWAIVLLFFPAVTLLAGSLAGVFGAQSPLNFTGALALILNPLGLIGLMVFTLIIGPFPEEIGWRGYFLEKVQSRLSTLPASLIVGLLHWSWHLPLFLLPGYWAAFNTAPPTPLDLAFVVLPATVLYAWVYNNTGRSVLAVMLFHFTGNFSGQLFGISAVATTYRLVLVAIAVIIVVWQFGPTLIRNPQSPKPWTLIMARLGSTIQKGRSDFPIKCSRESGEKNES